MEQRFRNPFDRAAKIVASNVDLMPLFLALLPAFRGRNPAESVLVRTFLHGDDAAFKLAAKERSVHAVKQRLKRCCELSHRVDISLLAHNLFLSAHKL